jgi:hypothetical protein
VIWLLLACGADPPVAAGFQPATRFWVGGDVYLGEARPFVSPELAAELRGFGVVNLEGALGDGSRDPTPEADGTLRLTHAPATLDALPAAGVALASIANNHATDGSDPASALAERGVAAFGRGSGCVERDRVHFCAWDLSEPAPELPDGRVVAMLHVGGPPDPRPTEAARAAAEAAVGAGADLVVVNGTHGFGGVERRGDAAIAWGLGNLAFDCRCTAARDAVVLDVTWGDRAEPRLVPIRAGLHGEAARLAEPGPILDILRSLGSEVSPDGRF